MSDLISRKQAIDALNDEYHGMISDESMKIYQIINWLNELPSAEPHVQPRREERKIGEWIYDWGDWGFETCKCSECGNHMTTPIGERYSFCPNCGCKMEVDNG